MAQLRFYRGTASEVDRHLYEEGSIYVIQETGKKGKLAIDLDGTRYVIGGLETITWDDIQNKPSFTNDNTTYTLTQDNNDGHKLTFTGTDGSITTITIPDNNTNTTYTLGQDADNKGVITLTPSTGTKQSVEIPIKGTTYSIGISDHTIILTGSDGSKTTATVPDNNTTYSAGIGITLSGTTFSNAGVRAVSTGDTNGTIKVNTNGTTAEVEVKGLGSAAYTASTAYAAASHNHSTDNITSGVLPIARGGTGGGTRTLAFNNLAYFGTNITGGTDNDTRTWWQEKGTGYCYFSALNQVNGQPAQYGFLINLVSGGEVHQEWWTQNNGAHYHRGGNGSTVAMPSWTANNTDTNTWNANALNVAGYVAAPNSSTANKVWKTDATGNPAWRDDTDTVYTHPTTSGNKHIPSGGSSGQILRWSADGTAVWGADNNTHSVIAAATQPTSADCLIWIDTSS